MIPPKNYFIFKVHVLHKGSGQWYEMQDLHVTNILPQMITLTEAYIQVSFRRIYPHERIGNSWQNYLSLCRDKENLNTKKPKTNLVDPLIK